MPSMFEGFNETLRKKLIALYEDFIKNPEDNKVKENAAAIAQRYANSGEYNLKPEIHIALTGTYDIELDEMTLKEAEEILSNLITQE